VLRFPFHLITRAGALILPFILTGCLAHRGQPPIAAADLHRLPAGIETRWASPENWLGAKGQGATTRGGRKGSPCFPLKAGESKVLADVQGHSGMVRRIWITISDRPAQFLRGLKLEMFWDGAATPAVAVPLGDFFCQGLGQMTAFENALFSSPEARSFNCLIPMPFREGMKIVVTNESADDLPLMFYDIDYTLGDRHGDDMLYFHAHWRRENPTTLRQDFEILPRVSGRGRFLGTLVSVIVNQEDYLDSWWGEGEVKVYLDGDRELPTLVGTGTEDYIGTGWGQGQYANHFQGCPVADHERMRYAFYRLHIPDPIYFQQDCRVTLQQIGYVGEGTGKALKELGKTIHAEYEQGMAPVPPDDVGTRVFLVERQDDVASCAYFYLDRPTNDLPPLAPFADRIAALTDEPED